ncbi:hypothetical protein ES705_16914 [subsurface metagenome]
MGHFIVINPKPQTLSNSPKSYFEKQNNKGQQFLKKQNIFNSMNKEYLTRDEITKRLEPLKEVDLIAYISMKARIEKREEKKKQQYFMRRRLGEIRAE